MYEDMICRIYKLNFSTAVHFGSGSLTDTDHQLAADTIFSALCQEAADASEIAHLVDLVEADKLLFSDALPFIGNTLYIPKPAARVQAEQDGDSIIKKYFKKLQYIPWKSMTDYLQGRLDPQAENTRFKQLGQPEIRTLAAQRNKAEAEPFFVGTYRFHIGSGLYIIALFQSLEIQQNFELLLQGLQLSGIGGRRSAGLGKFQVEALDFSAANLTIPAAGEHFYMTLSLAMAQNPELASALQGANYTLLKRSGFVSSTTYAPTNRRKRDFYAFQSGACFQRLFKGGVFEVSGNGAHKVYRYAKPLFLEVK